MGSTDLVVSRNSENPFDYDENDLDLDQFCLMIQRELHEITAVCFFALNLLLVTNRSFLFFPTALLS
jgi:predicted membrane chloride channel (bestrophin family)